MRSLLDPPKRPIPTAAEFHRAVADAQLENELLLRDLGIKRNPAKPCPEPHHAHQHDEQAHRKHHWRERLFCLSCCTALHVVLEVISHYWK